MSNLENAIKDDSLYLKSFTAELIYTDGSSFFIKNTNEPNDNGHFKPILTVSRQVGCASEVLVLKYLDTKGVTSKFDKEHGEMTMIKLTLIDSMVGKVSQDKCTYNGKFKIKKKDFISDGRGTLIWTMVAVDVYSEELSKSADNTNFKPSEGLEDNSTFSNFFKMMYASIKFKNGDPFQPDTKKNNNDIPKNFKLDNKYTIMDNLYKMAQETGYVISYVGGANKLLLHRLNKEDFKELNITFTEPKPDSQSSKGNIMYCESKSSSKLDDAIMTMYHDKTKPFPIVTRAKEFLNDLLLNNNSDCLKVVDSYGTRRSNTADAPATVGLKMCAQMLNMNKLQLIVPGHFDINNISTIVNVKKHIIGGKSQQKLDNKISGKWFVLQIHYLVEDYKFVTVLDLNRIDNPTTGNPALEESKTQGKKITKNDLNPLEHKKKSEYKSSTEYKKLSSEFGADEVDGAISTYMYFKSGSVEFPHDPKKLDMYRNTLKKNNVRNLARESEGIQIINAIRSSGQVQLPNTTLQSDDIANAVNGKLGDKLPHIGAGTIEDMKKVADGGTITNNPSIFFFSEFKKYLKTHTNMDLKLVLDKDFKPSSYLTEDFCGTWAVYWYKNFVYPYYTFICDIYRQYDNLMKENNSTLEFNGKNSTSSNANRAMIQKAKEG